MVNEKAAGRENIHTEEAAGIGGRGTRPWYLEEGRHRHRSLPRQAEQEKELGLG
jgi:hypothetical protein